MATDPVILKEVFEYEIPFQRGKTWKGRLDEDLAFNEKSLDAELMTHAAKFAWWASLHASAKSRRDDIKRQLKLMEYDLRDELLDGLPEGEKKPTEPAIEAFIQRHRKYVDLEVKLRAATADVERLDVARDAMTQRKDMLMASSASQRREQASTNLDSKADRAARLEEGYDQRRREEQRPHRSRGGR
jgi:hypothetical protein